MGADAATWAAGHGTTLVGLPAAAAEEEVRTAGLRPRVAGPGEMLTLDFRSDRVTLLTDADGLVTEVRSG